MPMLCFFKTQPRSWFHHAGTMVPKDNPMPKLKHAVFVLIFAASAATVAVALRAEPGAPAPANQPKLAGPEFSADGKLQRPVGYRNWRFVSTGLGMSYGPAAEAAALTGHVMFDNVFVQPQAYDAFVRDGVWPEGTMFVLELRGGETQRPPNNRGYFQTEVHAIEVSVKDSARFKGRWAYFEFGMEASRVAAQPESGCFACHTRHAAVDMTFVQFYPTLQKVKPAH
jgi:hypothetical protein